MQDTCIRPLSQEDPLEKEMAGRRSILGRENPHGRRRLVGYSPRGHKESDAPEHTAQYPIEWVDHRQTIHLLGDMGFHLAATVSLGVQAFVQLSAASVSKTVGGQTL